MVAALVGLESELVARIAIIGGTIVVALLIGWWLYILSQRSSQEGYQRRGATTEGPVKPAWKEADALLPAIVRELGQVPLSDQQRERLARTMSAMVTKTIDARLHETQQQLDAQYGRVIEEQRREKTVLQRKYQEVLAERKQTEAVLESIAEGLVVVNNRGEVVMMNPAAERLLAVSQKDRIGKPLVDDLKEEQLVALAHNTNQGEREIVLSATSDSTKRILRASNAVIADEDGNAVGMVAVLSDVTKQRELDQLKAEFVSKISHELRTPLVAMKHALSLIVDQVAGPLTDEQKKFAGVSQRNLDRLNRLINDLLDLSKLEAKKMELHIEPGQLGPVIDATCESLDAWARSKAITVVKRVPQDLPEILCDKARITQVLTNLIGNAIKFTPTQGRVTVEAKRIDTGDAIEVDVTDTGIGIAKEDLPKLFSKFQQVGERSATDISGTGLGLAISKEIIELHHGRIWAEGELTQGARFSFTLPVASAGSAPSGAPSKPQGA